jgi:histidinol dehydrogenase
MNIGFYKWSETDKATKSRIMRRSEADIDAVIKDVRPIIEDVKARGDAALIDYAKKFDRCDLKFLKVSEAEFEEAHQTLDPKVKEAIDYCANNVRKFHAEQMARVEKDREWLVEIEQGVWAGEKITPVSSVGLYVPGGKNQYPSAVYMLGIPATLAGVEKTVMVTPPRADGKIGDALLYAAEVSGIKDVYKVGGAQAIAALAYSTQSVPAVKKVLGPGSPFVAVAKQLLNGIIDAGMPAGPSESIILCDGSTNAHNTVLDLLNEAEHGPDSAALLVTHDEKLAKDVHQLLPEAINALPEPQKDWLKTNMEQYGGIILTNSIEESIVFCNEYATEHLLVKLENPDEVVPQLLNAGEILIGENTPSSFGNYGIGVNHVLPTGGKAHSYSCTSVWDFLKRTSIAKMDKEGFDMLKDPVTTLTDYEGFPAHGNVIRKRKIN